MGRERGRHPDARTAQRAWMLVDARHQGSLSDATKTGTSGHASVR
jgi:hypothetical protein